MAQQDLDVAYQSDGYALTAVTEDPLERLRNRFRSQFLSSKKSDGRGSLFYSQLQQGLIRTNSDIISLFYLSAADILLYLRQLQMDAYITRASLTDFEIEDSRHLTLWFTLYSSEGTIDDTIEVAL